jgi:hypothetical protein
MANDQDVNTSQPLTAAQREELIARMKTAWANLPGDKRAALKPLLEDAHQQLGNFLANRTPPQHGVHQILRLKSYLTDDWEGHVQRLDQPLAAKAIEITVGPGGEILGTGKYQELDPLWELVAGTVWLENLLHQHPFPPGTPTPVQIPDQVTIALAGDFGTGNFGASDSPSTKISKFVPSLNPHFTIHLGDVYYAGTSGEESSRLMNFWPQGSLGSFALNSNHEMYSGGGPYFDEAVGGPVFNKLQSPFSFFALENSNWIIVGLDSAYNADVLKLYMDGSLGNNAQLPFLRGLAQKGKKVIILTHHNGLPENGQPPQPQAAPLKLFTEVLGAFDGAPPPAYWYWGHVHAGVAYQPLKDYHGLLCRCVGHAALPWGLASDLQTSQSVQWFERCNAQDPENHLRVFNGFVLLQLDGANLAETFYDETGRVAWTPQGGDPRGCAG